MTMVDFITALSCQVDMPLHTIPTHLHATLGPSEGVTPRILHALTGVGNRAFYRWPTRDYGALFPGAPRAHPPLSPLQAPSSVAGDLLGRPDGAWRHRPLWVEMIHSFAGMRRHFCRDIIKVRVSAVHMFMAIGETTSWNMVKG